MIKKWLLTIFNLVLFYILQTTIFKHIELASVVPNLIVLLTVANGYIYGNKDGLLTGLLCGLFSDCVYGSFLGVHGMILMFVGYVAGFTHNTYSKTDFVLPVIYIGIGDLMYGFLYYVFEFLLRGKLDIAYYFRYIILPEALYTLLAAVVFYKFVSVLNKLIAPKDIGEAL